VCVAGVWKQNGVGRRGGEGGPDLGVRTRGEEGLAGGFLN